MRFKDGLKLGSYGGHGRIRYSIIELQEGNFVKFKFSKPDVFDGTHQLMISEIDKVRTQITHEIRMSTSFKATFFWVFIIRWLHDALIEDAFDKVENYFQGDKKNTVYNFWVKQLRAFYKRKALKTKTV